MPRILSLSLRPRTLSGMFGQGAIVKSIRSHMATRAPQAWLFHGGTGCGKTTLARIMSVAYQCEHMKLWGDPCPACWTDASSYAIHEVNASEVSGVEEIGKIASMSRTRPMGCAKRVIILDEMQRVSSPAQNLLLKPTEEPPSTTIWIFCTTEPGKILATLRRRCTTYQLHPLGFTEREKFLQRSALAIKFDAPLTLLFEQVHLAGISSPALLLMALEKFTMGSSAEEAVAGTDGVSTNSLRICKAVTAGDWRSLRDALVNASPEESRWIRGSVSGWLRKALAEDNDSPSREKAALSLYDLSTNTPIDDASMLYWLWAVLYKICKRYERKI